MSLVSNPIKGTSMWKSSYILFDKFIDYYRSHKIKSLFSLLVVSKTFASTHQLFPLFFSYLLFLMLFIFISLFTILTLLLSLDLLLLFFPFFFLAFFSLLRDVSTFSLFRLKNTLLFISKGLLFLEQAKEERSHIIFQAFSVAFSFVV